MDAKKRDREQLRASSSGRFVSGEDQGGAQIFFENSSLEQQQFQQETDKKLKTALLQKEEEALPEVYQRIVITPEQPVANDVADACSFITSVVFLRKKWLFKPKPPVSGGKPSARPFDPFDLSNLPAKTDQYTVRMEHGVCQVYNASDDSTEKIPVFPVGNVNDYYEDLRSIMNVAENGACKTFAYGRLALLEQRFDMHLLLNENVELAACKRVAKRDFYNVRKIDTHLHHSAIMNQKHLLTFIKQKLRHSPDEVVILRDEKLLTLKQVFESIDLTVDRLSVDMLDVHADHATFHDFSRFNLKYNPCGQSRLREVFLKTDNYLGGRYLAEITREVFQGYESQKYHYAEPRLSVYGRSSDEWQKLSRWIVTHKLYSDHVRWMIQIPRLYNVYREQDMVQSFQEFLHNIFAPLFAVSLDPSVDPNLHLFLLQMTGFDCVDDESKSEFIFKGDPVKPEDWTEPQNPPYGYYLYYLYANIHTLNQLRESRGLSTFSLRPHAGEAGSVNHLASAFMLARNISHGITLRKAPVLQFLYYLTQIGLSVSPLSNNKLFLDLSRSPFPTYFKQGLCVTLSTDDPLQFHYSVTPLTEEYSVAAQVWKLGPQDICEIARNSIYISDFDHECKQLWLGESYRKYGAQGNEPYRTNVPNVRLLFRSENLQTEIDFLLRGQRSSSFSNHDGMQQAAAFLERLKRKYANVPH